MLFGLAAGLLVTLVCSRIIAPLASTQRSRSVPNERAENRSSSYTCFAVTFEVLTAAYVFGDFRFGCAVTLSEAHTCAASTVMSSDCFAPAVNARTSASTRVTDFSSRRAGGRGQRGQQSFFAVEVLFGVHRFGHAVGEQHERVAGLERKASRARSD